MFGNSPFPSKIVSLVYSDQTFSEKHETIFYFHNFSSDYECANFRG